MVHLGVSALSDIGDRGDGCCWGDDGEDGGLNESVARCSAGL